MRSQRIKQSPKLAVAAAPGGMSADVRARDPWAFDRSDELLSLAVRVGGIGIFDTDLERKRTRFSPELCTILGLPVGTDMTYSRASLLFDERDRAAVIASVEAARDSTDQGKW